MACLVVPQALNISLSMRELVRQGYLFGAHVLLRSLVERAAILLYLQMYPEHIDRWNRGWNSPDAPGLAKMFEAIQKKSENSPGIAGRNLTAAMNSLLLSKPSSAPWSLVSLDGEKFGHASSKMLDRPDLCDDLCANTIPWLLVVQAMMAGYFPEASPINKPTQT